MDGQVLAKIFEASHGSLTRNLEGITHEESLRAPEPGGNSLNWVLGHLLYHRNVVMKLLNQPPVWDPGEGRPLCPRQRSPGPRRPPAAPGVDPRRARPFAGHPPRGPAGLHRRGARGSLENGNPLAQGLIQLGFHEGYHGGQISMLRRFLGHAGAIQ